MRNLELAKNNEDKETVRKKDSICIFGEAIFWDSFHKLQGDLYEKLLEADDYHNAPSSFCNKP